MDRRLLDELGLSAENAGAFSGSWTGSGSVLTSTCPATEEPLGRVRTASPADYDRVTAAAREEFLRWRTVPAPHRGELVRRIGESLRRKKSALARLVCEESGKILSEAEGEVQEMIDIADFAVGLSRTIGGVTLPSERPHHVLIEQWHPLGPVGVITAFNFPVAVWAWNAMIAAVAGDTVVWKPSEKTPLSAIAATRIAAEVLEREGHGSVFGLLVGGPEIGQRMAADPSFPLVSATGSCRMGRSVAATVAGRLGRTILELGGNNAVVVLADADLDLALRAIVFGAVGTAGQRCTTTRRLIVDEAVADDLEARLVKAYGSVRTGEPWAEGTLLGPLIDADAARSFEDAVERIRKEGGTVILGGKRLQRKGHYVEPTLVRARRDMPIVGEETFAPILYIIRVRDLDEAIAVHNSVPQGLSSAIFTSSIRAAEKFRSPEGSDCGIANVNLGTSGAEIGAAFGGEKDTGGGREAGSDAWKAYMRRQASTVNYGKELPLAQGVRFDI